MKNLNLGEMEQKFAHIIWDNEPIPSGELVKICEKELCWKKSTTYTMLKRLCERKIFINQNGTVSALMSNEEFLTAQGEEFLNESFGGSLPKFLAAFTRRNKLSNKDIDELQQLINDYKEE